MADQITMQTRCLGGFSVTWVPKLLLPAGRIRIFGPKRPNVVQNMLFRSFLGQIWAFLAHFVPCRTKNDASKVSRWFFHYADTKTFAFSSKKIEIGLKLAFLVILGQACWWIGWLLWRAGCISQDTYLLLIYQQTAVFQQKTGDENGFCLMIAPQ